MSLLQHRIGWPGGAALLLAAGLMAVAGGYLSAAGSRSAAIEAPPAETVSAARGLVQAISATSLTISTETGGRDFLLTPATRFEMLRPVDIASVRTGDWVNAGAVPNAQTLYAITGIVLLRQGSYEAPQR